MRGDRRGWRARHHREHCEGDYKNPPPEGKFDKLYELSKRLMKRDAVHVEAEVCAIVVEEFVSRLDHNPRHWLGLAKKHTSHLLRQLDLAPGIGGIWAKRSKAIPIRDRAHQLNVVGYLLDHEKRGAAIWCIPQVRTWAARREAERRRA